MLFIDADDETLNGIRQTTFWLKSADADGRMGNRDRTQFFADLLRKRGVPVATTDVVLALLRRLEATLRRSEVTLDEELLVHRTGADGIERANGTPAQAARQLREQGITVHLIGFGMGSAADEDTASLQDIYALVDDLEPVEEPEAGFRPVKSYFFWPLGAAFALVGVLCLAALLQRVRLGGRAQVQAHAG